VCFDGFFSYSHSSYFCRSVWNEFLRLLLELTVINPPSGPWRYRVSAFGVRCPRPAPIRYYQLFHYLKRAAKGNHIPHSSISLLVERVLVRMYAVKTQGDLEGNRAAMLPLVPETSVPELFVEPVSLCVVELPEPPATTISADVYIWRLLLYCYYHCQTLSVAIMWYRTCLRFLSKAAAQARRRQ
jgi:hypothetical protein